ncbi:alpha carbonic anhydrase 7-like [Triticum urartu]|uniref:Carbonic anhydrase n=1 Tax=Triticum urartu TaxID=4572 RepID=A0A8R7R7M0_TRIUA|nr:alpha carbonic anhydrase 7-like [Triticum urartu]XP_048539910.1 alpha carbonic anhydrase 7-like [Triticum urartu]
MAGSSARAAAPIVPTVVFVFLLLLPLSAVRHARAQESDSEDEFSYRSGRDNSPDRWGLLRSDWAACYWGRLQSPIRVPGPGPVAGPRNGRLARTYRSSPATLVNRGHDIMVRFDGNAGSLVLDGVSYRLRQMHWHSPSEHALNGSRYDLELHMLHQSDKASNKYAVVAQLFQIGEHRDEILHMLEPFIERITDRRKGYEEEIDYEVDPRRPVRGSDTFYRYTGSFTTPPCTEGIAWAVATKVRHVSRQQVELLKDAVHDHARRNARPLQEANGRGIALYHSWPRSGPGN